MAKKTSKTAVPTANIIISSIFETEIQSINEMFSWAGTRIKGEKIIQPNFNRQTAA